MKPALAPIVLAALCAWPACGGTARASQDVIVNIEHSRFEPQLFEFRAGETVRFVVHNGDPIDHEFIVGDESVQTKHESGTHASHGAVPGEISVPARTTRSTTYTFEQPGRLIVGCHLPAHYDYGMRAEVIVRP